MNLPPEITSVSIHQPGSLNVESNQEKPIEKSRQCPICKVYYKYGNSYWQHVRYVHANFLSQCIICGKSYKRTTMAKQHVLHFHKIAWHLCGNYVKKVKKNDHVSQNKIKEKSLDRRKQNLKYFKKKTLHLISCFNCYDCPGTFTTINELFDHVKEHRNKQEADSDFESDTEDVQNNSETETDEIQNELLKDNKEIQNESVNEDEEIQDGSVTENEGENDQNNSANEMEDVPDGEVNKEMANERANEFEAMQNLLANDDAFEIP